MSTAILKVVVLFHGAELTAFKFGQLGKYIESVTNAYRVTDLMKYLNDSKNWEVETKKDGDDMLLVYTHSRYIERSQWQAKYKGTYLNGATYEFMYSPYALYGNTRVNVRYGEVIADIESAVKAVDGKRNKAKAKTNAMRHYGVTESDLNEFEEYYTCHYYDC